MAPQLASGGSFGASSQRRFVKFKLDHPRALFARTSGDQSNPARDLQKIPTNDDDATSGAHQERYSSPLDLPTGLLGTVLDLSWLSY